MQELKQFLREEIVRISKQSFEMGLFAGTSGNLSAFIPEEGSVLITPSSVRYETMRPEDIVEIDLDGKVLDQNVHKPSSEHKLHCAIYRERPDIKSVFHTHSPYATAFAVNQKKIPLILLEMVYFLGGDVPCTPIQVPGTPEVGQVAVAALAERNACTLANHGVVAIGKDPAEAMIRAEYVEDAAKIATFALQIGEAKEIPHDVYQRVLKGY